MVIVDSKLLMRYSKAKWRTPAYSRAHAEERKCLKSV